MDPIGKQKKIASSDYHVGFQKMLDGGGAKEKYDGQRNMKSGTRKGDTPKFAGYGEFQGTTKGATTHTYKKGGK